MVQILHPQVSAVSHKPTSVFTDAPIQLSDALMKSMVEAWGGSWFLPESRLSAILNKESVFRQLQSNQPNESNDTVRDRAALICSPSVSSRKVFAILVLLEKNESIGSFIDQGVDDGAFPLAPLAGSKSAVPDLRSRSNPDVALTCFKTWSIFQVKLFEQTQKAFLAPVFERQDAEGGVMHFTIRASDVLPFLKLPRSPKSDGILAGRRKFLILTDHHCFGKQL